MHNVFNNALDLNSFFLEKKAGRHYVEHNNKESELRTDL